MIFYELQFKIYNKLTFLGHYVSSQRIRNLIISLLRLNLYVNYLFTDTKLCCLKIVYPRSCILCSIFGTDTCNFNTKM